MNIERLNILADRLESCTKRNKNQLPKTKEGILVGFDMGTMHPEYGQDISDAECDSACCIGGWANLLFSDQAECWYDSENHASQALGLDSETGHKLFYPDAHGAYAATPQLASVVVRRLIETGNVDWEGVLQAEKEATKAVEED